MMNRLCVITFMVLLQILGPQSGSSAQISIRGVVIDPAGAPIAGAVVEVISVAVNGHKTISAEGRSNSDGAFRFEASDAGVNIVRISVPNRDIILITLKKRITPAEADLGKIKVKIRCSDPGIICDAVDPKNW